MVKDIQQQNAERRLRNAKWQERKSMAGYMWLVILLALLALVFVAIPAYRLLSN